MKVPYEAILLTEETVGLEGHSLLKRVCIKTTYKLHLFPFGE